MDPSAVSVLIVDDQAPFRRAAAAVVRVTGGFEVAGEAGSGEESVDLAGALVPNLVLMNINMGGINGIEAARRITAALPRSSSSCSPPTRPPTCRPTRRRPAPWPT